MRILLIGSVIIIYSSSCGQTTSDLILGHWKEVKKTLKDGETGKNVTFNGKDYEPAWDFVFDAKGICHDLKDDFKYSFNIHEGKLQIGNNQYVLVELTKTKLVLTDYDKQDPENPFGFIHYFERVE